MEILLLLPGIDFGFRYKLLFVILLVRIIVGAVIWLIKRKNENTKKK